MVKMQIHNYHHYQYNYYYYHHLSASSLRLVNGFISKFSFHKQIFANSMSFAVLSNIAAL